MKTVTVRRLPLTSLAYEFSRDNEQGKFDVYSIPYQYVLSVVAEDSDSFKTAEKILKEYFEKTLGEEVELVFAKETPVLVNDDGQPIRKIVLIDESMFTPSTIKALKKVKATGTLHQYLANMSVFPDVVASLLDAVGKIVNRLVIDPTNALLHTLYGLNPIREKATWAAAKEFEAETQQAVAIVEDYFNETYNTEYKKYQDLRDSKFFLPRLIESRYFRVVTPVSYLAITCEEEALGEAIESLSIDLDILASLKLIRGNLAMPTTTELMNTVGNGKKVYGVYSFLILDMLRLLKILGKESPLDLSPNGAMDELKKLGVVNLVYEGGINALNGKNPYSDLVGETVTITNKADEDELTRLYKQMNEDNARVKAAQLAKIAAAKGNKT